MQKYFITKEELSNNVIISDDVFHISNVMRSKINDEIIVSDEEKTYLVSITSITKKEVTFKKVEEITICNELPFFVSIFQGYPKGDKLDDIIKHCCELGVYEIYPVFTKRSNVKLDKSKYEHKLKRFNKISKEAAEQSNRNIVPKIKDILNLDKIDFTEFNHKIICYEESAKKNENSNFKQILKNIKEFDKIAVVIGPEGGLNLEEVNDLISKGFTPIGLGKRILRTESTSMYVLSAISYEWELK